MEWNENFATCIEDIDNQHREIINHVNYLLDCCNREEGKEVVYEALDSLGGYAIDHFRYEENLQKEKNYPKSTEHRTEHDSLVELIQDMFSQFEKGEPYSAIIWRTNSELSHRFSQHFSEYDKEFAEHVKEHSIVMG